MGVGKRNLKLYSCDKNYTNVVRSDFLKAHHHRMNHEQYTKYQSPHIFWMVDVKTLNTHDTDCSTGSKEYVNYGIP